MNVTNVGVYDNIDLPKTVKIAAKKYNVNRITMGDGGEILFRPCVINISNDCCQDKSEEVLCHELMEAVNDIYELELPHNKIQIIGAAWHQIMKENDLRIHREGVE